MDDAFKIYVEQLRDGHVEQISEKLSSEFLEINERDLKYLGDVTVTGEAYLANDDLILHLNAETIAVIPCSICNEPVKVGVSLKGFYHSIPLLEIKGAIFNYMEILRENIVLETPSFAECEEGRCPHRKEIAKYLKKPGNEKKQAGEEGHHPFADFDWEQNEKKT